MILYVSLRDIPIPVKARARNGREILGEQIRIVDEAVVVADLLEVDNNDANALVASIYEHPSSPQSLGPT
jgi:hypothetical protein